MLLRCQTGYTLRQIENTFCLLPYGQQIADQKKGIALNETSVFLWNAVQRAGCVSLEDLASNLVTHYDLDEADFSDVLEDVKSWATQLIQYGMLIESLKPVSEEASLHLSIAGLSLHLYDPDGLVGAAFDAFRTDSAAAAADQRIDLLNMPPDSRSYGQVLLQNKEMTIFHSKTT